MPEAAPVTRASIPTYILYGESDQEPGAEWVHCETVPARSRLHNYRIQPHRHERLFQLLHLTHGQAEIVIDGQSSTLAAPCIVTLPPMVVHGYAFSHDVEGTVISLLDSRLAQLLGTENGLEGAFRTPQLIPLQDQENIARTLAFDIAALAAEFSGHTHGRLEMMESRLTLIFVALRRARGTNPSGDSGRRDRGLQHALRFRQLVDQDYRSQKPIEAYAQRLGLTSTHLNRICREHLGNTALGAIHQRIILEAKRYLTFTSLSAKEIAISLNFDDPAYFTRFFKQKTGLSPLGFRAAQRAID